MKASSVGLECIIEINEEEFKILEDEKLEGVLRFYPVGNIEGIGKREIPFTLKYEIEQKESIECSLTPKRKYFGTVDFIEFKIGYHFYEDLKKYGGNVKRFWS